jgi:DNA primase
MGARLTPDQKKVLQRLGIESVVLMMDNDQAGIAGALGVYEQLQGSGIRVTAGWYRSYWNVKDPDGLDSQRYRKMYHSSLTMADWAREVA